jgi:hypothetical protein
MTQKIETECTICAFFSRTKIAQKAIPWLCTDYKNSAPPNCCKNVKENSLRWVK